MPAALREALEARSEIPRVSRRNGWMVVDWHAGISFPLWPEAVDLAAAGRRAHAAGIETTVLSVITPSVEQLPPADAIAVARACNDELAEAARQTQWEGVAALPWQAPDAAVAELERIASVGLRGAYVSSTVGAQPLDTPAFAPIFDAAAELGLPVIIHPAYPTSVPAVDAYALPTTLGFLLETSAATLRLILGGLFVRHPNFKLYLVHIGSLLPYILGRLDYEASRYEGAMGALTVPPSVHVRLLYTDSVCVWPPALRLALDTFGPERVMFGTDEPFWASDKALRAVTDLDLPPDTLERVWARNAEELFGLDRPDCT
jgi:predicted TIM-barrel fold metal-dependent hydrolase